MNMENQSTLQPETENHRDFIKKLPAPSFIEAVRLASTRLLVFKGRSRRAEYWWWMLFIIICTVVNEVTFKEQFAIYTTIQLLLSFSSISVCVRRLHDTGRSGWWVLAYFVAQFAPVVILCGAFIDIFTTGNANADAIADAFLQPSFWIAILVTLVMGIVMLVFMLLDGHVEENRYGESPKYVKNNWADYIE